MQGSHKCNKKIAWGVDSSEQFEETFSNRLQFKFG